MSETCPQCGAAMAWSGNGATTFVCDSQWWTNLHKPSPLFSEAMPCLRNQLAALKAFHEDVYHAFGLAASEDNIRLLDQIADVRQEARCSANVSAQLAALQAENERLRSVLEEVSTLMPDWISADSYSGGETYAGFSRRLQRLALAALAPNEKENL